MRKTVVRMPGPSWMANFLMSKMIPVIRAVPPVAMGGAGETRGVNAQSWMITQRRAACSPAAQFIRALCRYAWSFTSRIVPVVTIRPFPSMRTKWGSLLTS